MKKDPTEEALSDALQGRGTGFIKIMPDGSQRHVPRDEVYKAPPRMTRELAIEIARKCAKAKPQSYYAEPFQPHEWVIDAIMEAGDLSS